MENLFYLLLIPITFLGMVGNLGATPWDASLQSYEKETNALLRGKPLIQTKHLNVGKKQLTKGKSHLQQSCLFRFTGPGGSDFRPGSWGFVRCKSSWKCCRR
jgi:hypothetical protein